MTDVLTRHDFDAKVKERLDDGDTDGDYGGWFCVATKPYPCPADGCNFVAQHMTAAHLVVVWPAGDDPTLLSFAADARNLGRDPRVREWEPAFGPAISYYRWARIGRPVHGMGVRPGHVPTPRSFE